MANMGNIAYQLKTQYPTSPANTTQVWPIIETSEGIVLGYTKITASATLTALAAKGVKFAPGCCVICVHSDVVATVAMVWNTGMSTAPDFSVFASAETAA